MKNYRSLLVYGLVAIMAIGCSKENKGNGGEEEEQIDLGDEMSITFDMTVPATGGAATYAIASKDEHFVDNLTAVLFEEVSGEEYYRYHTHATTIENGTTNAKRFRIQVKKSTTGEKYRIVALTNLPADHVSDIVANLTSNAQDPKKLTKEQFLTEVNFKSVGKWNTTSSTNFTPLPMWGETPTMQPITTNLTPGQLGTIKLLRALARVDVGLDMVASTGNLISRGLPNFKLETVKVYNASNSGAIAPLVANLSATPGELKAQKPTLPTGVAVNTPAIAYTKASVADWDKGFIRDIYIAESDVKNATTAQTRTCVILKGYYTTAADLGSGITNTTVPTWYRIDFFKKGMAGNPIIEYLDILRNCRYHVNITKVSGPGYDTEGEALNSLPINLDAEVDVWDEYEGMDDIMSDGQYHLVVNKNSFEFYRDGRERILEIYTDHPSGWKVLASDLPVWIHLTPQNSDGETLPMTGKMDVSITLDPIDPSITDPDYFREGEFIITSGVMKKKIYIKQTNAQELTLEVTPRSITFRKSGSSGKSVTVTSFPVGIVRGVSSTGTIVWAPGEAPEDYNGTTLTSFTLRPEVNTQSNRLESTITITIELNGMVRSEAVTVIQLATDLLFSITNKPITYPAIGGAKLSFTVESDAPWQLSTDGISDPHPMLTLSKTDEQLKTTPGTVPYLFGLTANPLYDAERIANIYAKSSDRDFPQQMIEIKQDAQGPTLELNDLAANATVDFGTPTTDLEERSVQVTTNAGWVSILNTNHARVTSDWSPTFNLVQTGSTVPTQAVSENIIIKSQSSIIGMPAAGTEVSENFTIATRNHGTAPAVSRTLTVKRTIRPFWEYDAITPATSTVLAHLGQAVTVTANTNMKWSVGSNVATTISSAASPYDTGKPQAITIPLNNTWTNPRTVTVSSNKDGEALSNRATYTQPGYTLDYVSHTFGNPVPAAGKSGTVTFKTTTSNPATTNNRIRAWDDRVGKVNIGSAQIPAQATPSNAFNSASFTIAANNTFATRIISMQLNRGGTTPPTVGPDAGGDWGGWSWLFDINQTGCTMSGVVAAGTIPFGGGNWGVTMTTGYVGTYHIRAMVGATQVGINTTASGGGLKQVSIGINSSETARSVTFQYKEGATGAWRDIASSARTQSSAPGKLIANEFFLANGVHTPGAPHDINARAGNTLNQAIAWCTAQKFGGAPGWRIPTFPEMKKIAAYLDSIKSLWIPGADWNHTVIGYGLWYHVRTSTQIPSSPSYYSGSFYASEENSAWGPRPETRSWSHRTNLDSGHSETETWRFYTFCVLPK